MALNVNIIGRDSEGNLRALKVNSEGNLEISGFSEWGELLQGISDNLDILVDKLSGTIVKALSYTLPATAGGTTTNLEITPPAGKKWTIQHWEMLLTPPSAATTGTQRLTIQLTGVPGGLALFTLSADYTDRIQYNSGVFLKDANATPFSEKIRPSDPSVLANLLRGVEITSAVPLRFIYTNSTDGLQEGGTIKIAVIEEG